jgi:hypothetical protein
MLPVPKVDGPSVAFGDIKHMPKFETLPAEFKDFYHHPFCGAIEDWFACGATKAKDGIKIGDATYTAKDGVNAHDALAAIKAVLASWEPKHEHKIAACGFMLHEWFDKS